MSVWMADVSRTYEGTIYIEAETREEASVHAHELVASMSPTEFNGQVEMQADVYLNPVQVLPEGEVVWVGGAEGTWEFPARNGDST